MKTKVKLVLKNGYTYTGTITSEDKDKIVLIDKFEHVVTIDVNSISVREELQ